MPTPLLAALSADLLAQTILLASLLLVPRVLQRFRVPGAVTSLFLGAGAVLGLGLFKGDPTVDLLATFGIVTLFLTAGMDVDFAAMRGHVRVLVEHLVLRAVLLGFGTFVAASVFGLAPRTAALLALGVLTPSAGFILDSLASLKLYHDEIQWVRAKVIATELLALAVLLFVTQPDVAGLGVSLGTISILVLGLPFVLRAFANVVLPFAPNSEFAFLVLLAFVCSLVTKELGVYYLVGAFVVGIAARRLRERLPAMSSERILHALEAFGTLFVPFYFFRAGSGVRAEDLSLAALGTGVALYVGGVALRVGSMVLHHRISLREDWRSALRKSVPMVPTLVFSLVVVTLLRETDPDVPAHVTGGLVVYAVLTTITPAIVMPRLQVIGYEGPTVAPPSGGVS